MAWEHRVVGHVVDTRPSPFGDDLVDVTLVAGHDRKSWLPAVTFDDIVRYITDDGVQLDLR
jgi:hypothetical protein